MADILPDTPDNARQYDAWAKEFRRRGLKLDGKLSIHGPHGSGVVWGEATCLDAEGLKWPTVFELRVGRAASRWRQERRTAGDFSDIDRDDLYPYRCSLDGYATGDFSVRTLCVWHLWRDHGVGGDWEDAVGFGRLRADERPRLPSSSLER